MRPNFQTAASHPLSLAVPRSLTRIPARWRHWAALALSIFGSAASLLGHGFPEGSFEGRLTHAIALTPDGGRLLAVNPLEGRLSVFNVSDPVHLTPVLEMEIPVGIEPVSVRARTNDEVWVVNEVSDSVSIVSLSRRMVVETLQASDEPADVVFAQGKAFVTCARNRLLRVFDATTRQPLASVPLDGIFPRALATDAAGTKVFAAFLLSGNGTTILPASEAPAPPLPTNPALPPAPQTALIVPATDTGIHYTVLDRDVVEVDAVTNQVTRYLGGVGTNLFDIAIQPGTGNPWIAASEARNLVRFEPALRGHVADHRLTRLDATSGAATIFDLNPGIDYSLLPNPAAQAIALSQPTSLVFSADGATAWVAAFGSDRVARISAATGAVLARVEMRNTGETSRQMRGPRALVLHESRQRLYVFNGISESISVLGTASDTVLAEVKVSTHDPRPANVREGRGFLFDARLSGNGTMACATCHLDADLDGLAWDLGDPGGDMITVMGANLAAGDPTPVPRTMHPMKGPMMTRTLRALFEGAPFNWRGDRPTLQSFNPTFDKLMGGTELAPGDMDALAAYLLTLSPHPNPNRQLDDTLPAAFAGGDPIRGEILFNGPIGRCSACHSDEDEVVNNIDSPAEIGGLQPIKNQRLRTVYQRLLLSPQSSGTSLGGFGLLHDGTGFSLPKAHPYALDQLTTPQDFADVAAFLMCFDTDTPAGAGASRTFTAQNVGDAAMLADLAMIESQAAANISDVAARGVIGGRSRAFYQQPGTFLYAPDTLDEPPMTRAQILAALGPDDAITFLGLQYGRGSRFGGDRNYDGILDRDEPAPALSLALQFQQAELRWPVIHNDWVLESTPALGAPWETVTRERTNLAGQWSFDDPIITVARYYRLRRTW
jgi:DNA-binding beta-propeller fold protein YncE